MGGPRITVNAGLYILSVLAGAAFAATEATPRAALRRPVPREVLAFYYGWYGNPEVSQRWYHWKNVDTAKKHIDESTHYPVLGPYDSHDPKIVETHCRQAAEAGLTGFIVSWWGKDSFEDRGMPLMLATAQKHGLKITAYYETVPPRDHPSVEGALADLTYLTVKYGQHPAWLKVDGKPVIFVYSRALNELKLDGWKEVIEDYTSRNPAGAVFVGDQISAEAAQVFDGIHTYNPTGLTKGKSLAAIQSWSKTTFAQWVKTAGSGRIACVTIIPGFDDSVQPSRKPPRPVTDRYGGKTYRVMWQRAVAAGPDWILITSWNEWHEGSEIEASVELGDREWKTTTEFAHKFAAKKPRRESP